jgi:hypothetical protein
VTFVLQVFRASYAEAMSATIIAEALDILLVFYIARISHCTWVGILGSKKQQRKILALNDENKS